jgi:hypothetical protein
MAKVIFRELGAIGVSGNTIMLHLKLRGAAATWVSAHPDLPRPIVREETEGLVQAYWEFETEEEAMLFKLTHL